MMFLTHLAMVGWIPLSIGLFLILRPRRAVMAGFILAVLFLPNHTYDIPRLVDYTKFTAASLGLMFAATLFDWKTITNFRFRWVDIPVLVWCVVPFFSSMANDAGMYDPYGLYDGVSASLYQMCIWGFPYFLGRVYLTDHEALKEMSIALILAGLVYAPLCWFEIRMSPQLHNMVYGFHSHQFLQGRRMGGWRPVVFQQHGLALGMLMTATAVAAGWLWRARTIKKVASVPLWAVAIFLIVTAVFIKSALAILLLVAGIVGYYSIKIIKHPLPLLILLIFPLVYEVLRLTGAWSGENLVQLALTLFDENRAGSLMVRLGNEDRIAAHVLNSKPWLGWGTWGEFFVDEETIPDGLWVTSLGKFGIIGLVSFMGTLLVAPAVMLLGLPRKLLATPAIAPAVMLATICILYSYDCIMNAHPNLIFGLVSGGLASVGSLYWKGNQSKSWLQILLWRMRRRRGNHTGYQSSSRI